MITFENKHFKLDVDPVRRIVRVKRTSEKFASLDSVEQVFRELSGAVKDVPRQHHGLLLDLREGPLRNDEAFESTVQKFATQMFDGWRKTALLVKTAVGELQINRQARETGTARSVFRDEAEALRYLET